MAKKSCVQQKNHDKLVGKWKPIFSTNIPIRIAMKEINRQSDFLVSRFLTWVEVRVLDVDLALCHILQYVVECCWQQNRQCLWACVWCYVRSSVIGAVSTETTKTGIRQWRSSTTPWFMHLHRRQWKKYSSARCIAHSFRPKRVRSQIIFWRGQRVGISHRSA